MNTEPFNELVYYPGVDHPKEKKMFEKELEDLEKIYTERSKELKNVILNHHSAIFYLTQLIESYHELKEVENKLSNLKYKKERKEEGHD